MKLFYPQLIRIFLKAALLCTVCFCCATAQAQVLVIDATDRPIMPKEYTHVKGSPFLYDDWVKGTVRLANGIEYKDLFLMYDQVKDEIRFTYKDGKTQAFVDPVIRFTLNDKEFRRDVLAKNQPMPKEFFEVLADGDTKLLRRTSKKILDELNHAVATKQKSIHTLTSYFITTGDKLIRIKQDKKSVAKALNNHGKAIAGYIDKHNLNLKNEQDLVKLITYYNSLD